MPERIRVKTVSSCLMSVGFATLVRSMFVVGVTGCLVVGAAHGQDSGAASGTVEQTVVRTAPRSHGPPSVIVDIDDPLAKFQEIAGKDAVEAWNHIGEKDPVIDAAREAYVKYRESRDDPKARGEFKAAFARALDHVDKQIERFMETEGSAKAAYTRFEQHVKAGIQAYDTEQKDHQQQAKQHDQEHGQLLNELYELRSRFPDLRQPNVVLPTDVRYAVKKLNHKLTNAERKKLLAESRTLIAEENRADLAASLDAARQIYDELDLRYTIAADDQEVIRDIAEHDVQEMRRRHSKEQLKALLAARDGIEPTDGKGVWDDAFEDIKRRLDQRKRRGTGVAQDDGKSNQEAIDILRNLPPQKPVEKDVAAGKTAMTNDE